nr:ubiquitin-specific protease 13 [Tanacetum cinerariifolium]
EFEEEGNGVKTKVFKVKEKVVVSKFKKQNEEVEADVEGNESEKDRESEEDKEIEVSKESDDSKPGVKDVKMKGVKGNKTVVVLKAKKRMHVSYSSSEEDKVSKIKKVSNKKKQIKDVKKQKHVFDSSSYDDSSSYEENLNKKKKKPLTTEQIKKIKYFDDLPSLRSRIVPSSLFAAIRDSQVDMESFLSDIGFSLLHNVYIDTLPQQFARFVVRDFSASSYEFKIEKGIIRVTPKKVHEILGVPLGGTSIFDLPDIPFDDPFVKEWFK